MKKKIGVDPIAWLIGALASALLLTATVMAEPRFPADKAPIAFLGARYDNIGFVTAVGDFNGDGQTDLFFSAPGD